ANLAFHRPARRRHERLPLRRPFGIVRGGMWIEPHGASGGTIVMERGAGRTPGGLEVSVEQPSAGLLVISPIGELDLSNRDLFLYAVEQARADPATALVIDLSGLTFMDSSGLRVLIDAWNESKVSERRLTVVVP